MNNKLCFKLFGNIYVLTDERQWKPAADFSVTRMGKKQQAFLAYLILNHSRKFSSSELIDQRRSY